MLFSLAYLFFLFWLCLTAINHRFLSGCTHFCCSLVPVTHSKSLINHVLRAGICLVQFFLKAEEDDAPFTWQQAGTQTAAPHLSGCSGNPTSGWSSPTGYASGCSSSPWLITSQAQAGCKWSAIMNSCNTLLVYFNTTKKCFILLQILGQACGNERSYIWNT